MAFRSRPTRRVKKPARWWHIRQELGLSQSELGAVFGVHWQTVGRWDRGEIVPGASTQWLYKLLLETHRAVVAKASASISRSQEGGHDQD
jgi:DNA-binding transcriptional regulator YiaG